MLKKEGPFYSNYAKTKVPLKSWRHDTYLTVNDAFGTDLADNYYRKDEKAGFCVDLEKQGSIGDQRSPLDTLRVSVHVLRHVPPQRDVGDGLTRLQLRSRAADFNAYGSCRPPRIWLLGSVWILSVLRLDSVWGSVLAPSGLHPGPAGRSKPGRGRSEDAAKIIDF